MMEVVVSNGAELEDNVVERPRNKSFDCECGSDVDCCCREESEQSLDSLHKNTKRVPIVRRRKSLPVIKEDAINSCVYIDATKRGFAGAKKNNGVILQERKSIHRTISSSQVQYVRVRAAIADHNRAELQALLRKRNINVNEIEPDGMAAIHYAAMIGTQEIIEILINEGAAFDVTTKNGEYPLDIAMRTGNYDVAQFLIEKGARLDNVVNGIPLEHHIEYQYGAAGEAGT
eukprot:gene4806-5436_t